MRPAEVFISIIHFGLNKRCIFVVVPTVAFTEVFVVLFGFSECRNFYSQVSVNVTSCGIYFGFRYFILVSMNAAIFMLPAAAFQLNIVASHSCTEGTIFSTAKIATAV